MGMAFDHHLGDGDIPGGHGTTKIPSSFDPIMLVIATASGCLFVTLVISCVCCFRKPDRHSRNANRYSRRDTVPLEDLLSKPTLADPESFFSEAPLDDKDPPHAIGYLTNNDDTSVASMSQMSDLSTSELVSNDSSPNHASMLERKSKSEKTKRSKNFQNRLLNNELGSSAKESRRQSDHILDNPTQNYAKIIVNDTQVDRLRDDDFLYKNNDFDYVNEINNTRSKRGYIDNKLKKTDNKDSSSTQKSLDIATIAEDRVSSESFTSSARGSISHDMTASVNVLRLPRQSLIPQSESWSNNLLEEPERSALPEVKEIPSPTYPPSVQFNASGQNAVVENGQSIQSTTKGLDDAEGNSPHDITEAFVDHGNSSGPYSVEIRPHIQENPIVGHSPESNQPVQYRHENTDQTNGRIPERISLNLQIDFHFSDKTGCCGNQTHSYVVCSPVSVSQETRGVSSSRMETPTPSSSTGKQPFLETQNSISDNTNCAIVQADGPVSEESQPHTIIDKANKHSISQSESTCEGKITSPCTRASDVSRKRFSTPIDIIRAKGMHDIELKRIEKRSFTVSDIANIEVILSERKLVQLPHPEIAHSPSGSQKIDLDFKTTSLSSLSSATKELQSKPSEVLALCQASSVSPKIESNVEQQKNSDISKQESHPLNAVNETEQIPEHTANPEISSQEPHLQSTSDNKDPDHRQQESSNISSHKLIPGKSTVKINEPKSDKQNEISGNVSPTTRPGADVVNISPKRDIKCIPNQENETSRLSNGGSEGTVQKNPIAGGGSLSEEQTKDHDICSLNVDTETQTEEKRSNLTPLNASILEDDEDTEFQSEEKAVTMDNLRKEEQIHSNKSEETDWHCNLLPLVNNEDHVQGHEKDKYLSNEGCKFSENDTAVDDVKTEILEKQDEALQLRQSVKERKKPSEGHDYSCKEGERICNNASVMESKSQNNILREEANCGKTSTHTARHGLVFEDGAKISNNQGVFIVQDREGQHYASNSENHGDASKDVKSEGDVEATKRHKMTESQSEDEIDKIIPSQTHMTSYKMSITRESELTQEKHAQNPGETGIKAADNHNGNISTSTQSFESNSLNTKTKQLVGEAETGEPLEPAPVPKLNFEPAQEQQSTPEKRNELMCRTHISNESKQDKLHETGTRTVSKPVQKDIGENTSNILRLRDEKAFDLEDPKCNFELQEKPQLKGILRVNRSFDMTFKEQDNIGMNFCHVQNTLGSTTGKGQSELDCHQNISPFVFVSNDIHDDKPTLPAKIETEEGPLLSPTLSLPPAEDKSNASDESDYDNPWDSLDEAVKRGSMRYNRRASRVADGSDAKTLMLKSAEDLGRLLEDAERRRRMRQNAARSSCQIIDTTPPSPPPTFSRLSPFRHTVKGLVSHGSSKDLQDDALKPHPLKEKKDRQRSKDDSSQGFTGGIDSNRAKTITAGERSKIYSPETKKRKGLLHRK